MPVDIDVKVVLDEDGNTRITFNKKALMEAPLAHLMHDTSTSVQIIRSPSVAEIEPSSDSTKR